MSGEPPEIITSGDFLFNVGVICAFIVIIYFIYNLFFKIKEINNKLDSFLIDTFKPDEISEPQKDVIEDISENDKDKDKDKDKESNVDLSGVDLSQDLDTITE